jgi:hypothetical protein
MYLFASLSFPRKRESRKGGGHSRPYPAIHLTGAKPLDGFANLQIRNPKRVQGYFPAEGLGVSLSQNSLESPFDKGGLRGLNLIHRRANLLAAADSCHSCEACPRENGEQESRKAAYIRSGYRSLQSGFTPSISSTFHALFHLLICFSLAMALSTSSTVS